MSSHEIGSIKMAHAITQTGGIITVSSGLVGWLAENHIIITSAGIVIGILVGLSGVYLQWSKTKLEKEEIKLRIARLKNKQ